jgi:hypothetical protein
MSSESLGGFLSISFNLSLKLQLTSVPRHAGQAEQQQTYKFNFHSIAHKWPLGMAILFAMWMTQY